LKLASISNISRFTAMFWNHGVARSYLFFCFLRPGQTAVVEITADILRMSSDPSILVTLFASLLRTLLGCVEYNHSQYL
jgi:hypothetical protein